MLADVDLSLGAWLAAALPARTEVDFQAPAAVSRHSSRSALLNLFLFDVAEDTGGLASAGVRVRGADGKTTITRMPVRMFRLSYLVTAWAADVATEHRLLGAVVAANTEHAVLPEEHLRGAMREAGMPIPVRVGAQLSAMGAAAAWNGLGIPMRTALELTVIAPSRPAPLTELIPPVETVHLDLAQLPTDAETAAADAPAPEPPPEPVPRRRWQRNAITES